MKRRGLWLVGATGLLLAWGCSGDMTKMLSTNTQMRDQIMSAISGNRELASGMLDRLLASDSTRTIVLDKLMSNGPAMQAIMAKMAGNETMIDGILNVAVQDTSMKKHVMTLFKGMQMGGGQ